VAHFAQGFGLDLADAFAGDLELVADFLKRAAVTVLEAETPPFSPPPVRPPALSSAFTPQKQFSSKWRMKPSQWVVSATFVMANLSSLE
jgi:hypothetical protein